MYDKRYIDAREASFSCENTFLCKKSQQDFETLKIIICGSLQSIYFKIRNYGNSYMKHLVKVRLFLKN